MKNVFTLESGEMCDEKILKWRNVQWKWPETVVISNENLKKT